MSDDDLLLVGRVARTHGNRGQVIVNLETDFPEQRFRVGAVLLVGNGADAAPRAITDVRFHQGRPVIALEGVDTMNDAEELAGAELRIPAATVEPLPDGTYYHHDLVGCDVRDTQGRTIGTVSAVEGPMDRSQLVVRRLRGGDALIPFVSEICERIDPTAREIVVNPPEGLLDLNDPGGGGRNG